MRICSVEHCDSKHEAKGYCKNHYKSFLKYGDALYAEKRKVQLAVDREAKVKIEEQTRLRNEKLSVCMLNGCGQKVYAKFLCNKHYNSLKQTGELEPIKNRILIKTDTCLALECNNAHERDGFCKAHLDLIKKLKSPYHAKIVKHCGLSNCNELHYSKGLCLKHYREWRTIRKKYKLDNVVDIKG